MEQAVEEKNKAEEQAGFEPVILAFLCNWCSYAGADLAGVSRLQYPPNVRVIRVMCSARVEPEMVIKGFQAGADGVLVLGCHIGDCHYIHGNFYTERKMNRMRELMGIAGLEPERLLRDWVSASEGEKYAKTITGFVNKVKEIGPLGLRENLDKDRLDALLDDLLFTVGKEKVKWLLGKEKELVLDGNVFGDKISQEHYDELMNTVLNEEYRKSTVERLLSAEILSVPEVAQRMGESSVDVMRWVVALDKEARIMFDEEASHHSGQHKYKKVPDTK